MERERETRQLALFAPPQRRSPLNAYDYVSIKYTFARECLPALLARFGFTTLGDALLHDLVIMRIIEPASTLRSIALIEHSFGITHRRLSFYTSLTTSSFQKLSFRLDRNPTGANSVRFWPSQNDER